MSAVDKKISDFKEAVQTFGKKATQPFVLTKADWQSLAYHAGTLGLVGVVALADASAYAVVPATLATGSGVFTHAVVKRITQSPGVRFFSGALALVSSLMYFNSIAEMHYKADRKEQVTQFVPVAEAAVLDMGIWQKHATIITKRKDKAIQATIGAVVDRKNEKGEAIQMAMVIVKWPSVGRTKRWRQQEEEHISVTRPAEAPVFSTQSQLQAAP